MFSMNRVKEPRRRNALGQTFEVLESRVLLSYALDPTFGSGGKVVPPIGAAGIDYFPRDGNGPAIEIQSDGKIVVAGYNGVLRYNVNGTLDTSFGGGDGRADVGGALS